MTGKGSSVAIRAALLAATFMSAAPVMAQDGSSVEERLDRLEATLGALIDRLDAQESANQQASANQQQMREQGEALMEATQALQTQQAQLAEQVEENTAAASEDGFSMGNTKVSFGGYVKVDAVSQRTSGGQLPGNSILRDFLIPSVIPVGGTGSGYDTDFNARQTRFFFKTSTDVGTEHTLNSHIELDFMVTGGGDERISNSFTPRLRQAFITYDDWLFGQTWSTFQNVGALPETMDFIGVTPGTVFDRQPMVRYTKGGLQIALEQPETAVTSPTGGRVLAGDDQLPDIVARYNWSGDWGAFSAAGIVRQLHVSKDDLNGVDDNAFGYGLSLSGKIKVGERDDVRFMATAGDGLGRYIGLNIINDAAVDAEGRLDPIFTYSGFAAYRHFWSENVRSTIAGSYFKADNPVLLTTDQVTDESWNALANIVWSPVAPLDVGVELMYAERTLEDGRSGNLRRVQFSTRYKF